MEKFGLYKYKIFQNLGLPGWFYQIYDDDENLIREAKEIFQYEGIARFAAIGHISLIEQGKG
jgi:hypothetical protein